jgi:histidine ammonia-lyase
LSVVLTGSDLTIADVVAVARDRTSVALADGAAERMAGTRAVVDGSLARGDEVYGLTTGAGVLKRVGIPTDADTLASFGIAMLRGHRVAHGESAPADVTRATMVCLANTLARGTAGVRPAIVERIVEMLNGTEQPVLRTLGSIGQADLATMADLALAVAAASPLAPGEALALLNNNAFSIGWAALSIADATRLVESTEAAGALSLEAFEANLTMLHPGIDAAIPSAGLARSRAHVAELLDGSSLFEAGNARNLQDPLTFRNVPQIMGAVRDVLAFAEAQVVVAMNASQGNPIVVAGEDRPVSVGNYENLPVALAADSVRAALATAVSASSERAVKLLETTWSGLPTGLTRGAERGEGGLEILGIAVQSFAAEARLLAQPVSFELVSTSHAEGIEDRMTMAPLAVRRLSEMIEIARMVVASELVVAAQATELRGRTELGSGTRRTLEAVRERFPFFDETDLAEHDIDSVVELVRDGTP